jgi:hypothetical protein
MKTNSNLLVAAIVALGIALLPLPYAYYMLLRVVMCGYLAFLAYTVWEAKLQGLGWTLGVAAVVYNPIEPLHLGREVWLLVNIATIGLLFYVRSMTHSFREDE